MKTENALRKFINIRFHFFAFRIATALDPRFKGTGFSKSSCYDKAVVALKDEVKLLIEAEDRQNNVQAIQVEPIAVAGSSALI